MKKGGVKITSPLSMGKYERALIYEENIKTRKGRLLMISNF